MIEKDHIDQNYNWNRRVKLPDSYSEDLLTYDYLNNIIRYNAKDKNGCKKGCELYFLIENNEKTKEESYLSEVSFSISKKWKENENGIIEMTLDKYVKGTLEDNKYDYYTITIPNDYKKISINLYSLYTKAYIKLGKNHFCNKEDHLWEINPKDGFGNIIIDSNDKSINKDTLKDISFSIGINKGDISLLGNEDLYYYLEIQGLYNNNKYYYNLNSERSIICDTGDDNYCHALLYINNNYYSGKSLLYALPSKKDSKVSIFAKFYDASEIERKPFTDSIQSLFPTNEQNKFDQKSEEKYIFLNYENIDKKKDVIILLTIYTTSSKDTIKLITSGFDSSKILLPYNTEKLIYFKENTNFYLPYDYKQ